MANSNIRVDTMDVQHNLETLEGRILAAVKGRCVEDAKEMENYAKVNRKWTDRTSMARRSLNGYVEEDKEHIRVGIAHGVDYGVHLELAHEKRYAILVPTLNKFKNAIMQSFYNITHGIRV